MQVWTVGHGTRSSDELVAVLQEAGIRTLVDVRRYPGSRRHPHFNRAALEETLGAAGIAYRHVVALGGRLSNEPGEAEFACIRVAAFRSYAARMRTAQWQEALARALAEPRPAFMCSETHPSKCHRRLVAELLHARGYDVQHLLAPGRTEPHVPWEVASAAEGMLYLCGRPVA